MIKYKITLIICFIVFLYVLLISRLFYFSVIKYEDKVDKIGLSENKRIDIVDRNNIVVASNIKVKNLYLNKELIENVDFISKELSKILNMDYDFLYNKITTSKNKYILIKKNIFPQDEYKIRQLPIASIVFEDDYLRFYPHNNLFSHVVGYVDSEKNGVMGIEEYYNNYLRYYENNRLKLTLDVKIQEALREELIKSYDYYKANFVVGIITEVKTGNVLALVSIPDFNPNDVDVNSNTFNFATYGNYELGSVFKIFTFANAIDNNIIDKDTEFNVDKEITYYDFSINDIKNITKRKKINTIEAFALSSNLFTVQTAREIGIKKQVAFFEKLGLLEKLNIDIKQTVLPLQPRRWSNISLMTIAYGYGIAVSPLHIISATNGILNNGILITPRFSYNFDKQTKRNVVSFSTSNTMKDLFRAVVEKGTGKLADINGLNVGGKTGTARKNSKDGYVEGEHIVSFVGAFPINDPQYSIIIVADRPKLDGESDGTGSSVGANIFKNVVLRALLFFDLKPIDNK